MTGAMAIRKIGDSREAIQMGGCTNNLGEEARVEVLTAIMGGEDFKAAEDHL